ncbi:MAG: DEAD/DEAH box helicase family protein [Elusimicrobia bacterium]|nr:DEAD/DEAH box helicase family protein [Elusimicrobiota bacterium]
MSNELEQARAEMERLRLENEELKRRLGLIVAEPSNGYQAKVAELPLETAIALPSVTESSSLQEKIFLFRSLFRGREDVYPAFWTNERSGKKGYSPACEDPWSLRKGKPRKYLSLTDQVIQEHLSGVKTVGVFPLLKDNSCWFLACDFDKEGWELDSLAYLGVCQRYAVPAYLERSRSGNGGHVWIFFSAPVAATQARQLGMRLLRQTMDARADLDLGSYDRFFPNQDFVPGAGRGFGNLIALPLQKKCRVLGNTEFLDPSNLELRPYPDQWAFLSNVKRLSADHLDALLETVPALAIGPGRSESVSQATLAKYPPPKQIRGEFGASLSIEKSGIPPWMLSKFKHLASLHNPKFYINEKLRFSNHQTPRFIRCYGEDFSHIHLPRGTFEEAERIIQTVGSQLLWTDRRPKPDAISFEFKGSLTLEQEKAMVNTLSHDMGVLVAPPGAGKTVMGCYAIYKRKLPTLILAHRKPILEQWRKHLMEFLDLLPAQIGQIGGGKGRQGGVVDLAMLQSLSRMEDVGSLFSRYGFIIADECHHIPAATFESCMKEAHARYILGLTATPYRRDELQDIITMQCGPVRYKTAVKESLLTLRLVIRESPSPIQTDGDRPIQEVFRLLVQDEARNALIERDVVEALKQGRRCLILSHWNERCQALVERLRRQGKKPFILSGLQGKKERAAILKAIQETPLNQDLIIVATGQYLGEGFDCPQLDTLFLAFPVSFKGKLIQYVGRIMREYSTKKEVVVYDYLDSQISVLSRMHSRRLKIYKSIGFDVQSQRASGRKTESLEGILL